MDDQLLAFGSFTLHRAQRLLLDDGKSVPLGSRALDVLIALIDRAGTLVSKEELFALAWPGVTVEENNLRVNIAALRKALRDGVGGNRFIANVPGRGYTFVAPVDARGDAARSNAEVPAGPRRSPTLPLPLSRMIGREEIIDRLVAQVPERRFVTLAGPGGIGKTTVALAVASALEDTYRDGVIFVDLAPVGDPALLPGMLAAALGIGQSAGDPMASLVSVLRERRTLLLLDSCEHLVEAVAVLAETLLRGTRQLGILATSREPLRAEGEWVHRLPPLGSPPASTALTAADALRFPAVQLFVERAAAAIGGYNFPDTDAPVIAEICRRLDGIALAIELAAGRLDAFGLRDLATQLDDRFHLLTQGRRTSLPRHRTLRAALDWSYDLLPRHEQVIFSRLSVFNGVFGMAAASHLAAGGEVQAPDIFDGVAGLVAKSLLVAEAGDGEVLYRLLDTARAYAREKLDAAGEVASLARAHAEYFRMLFERAEAEWESQSSAEWLATYARQIDNLRAALVWAFSAGGDPALGVALTVAAIPLWSDLSLIDECLGWVERALAVPASPSSSAQRQQMRLQAALGAFQMYSTTRVEAAPAAWTAALRIATEIGNTDYQIRALRALWADRINAGAFRESLEFAQQFQSIATASADAADGLIADRLIATSVHFLGDQQAALDHADRMLAAYVAPPTRSHRVRFQFDQVAATRIVRARALWLQGFADQAVAEVERAAAYAIGLDHTLSLCNVLTQAACPIALLCGDLPAARRHTALLRERAATHALDVWRMYAEAFEGELRLRCGEIETGVHTLRHVLDELRRSGFRHYLTSFLTMLALGLLQTGQIAEADACMADALAICARTGEAWCLAELHRAHGEVRLRSATPGSVEAAAAAFATALAIARDQRTPAWELRAATSMARLLHGQGRTEEAIALLAPVHAAFTEGFATHDLTAAAALLQALGSGNNH